LIHGADQTPLASREKRFRTVKLRLCVRKMIRAKEISSLRLFNDALASFKTSLRIVKSGACA
jgi:hypothetical protein